MEPPFQCCWQDSSFNIFLQHSWSVDLSNCRWKTEQMPAKLCTSAHTHYLSPSDRLFWSFLLARRRWRQQQILSGDTHSIKGALHHPDGLCRVSLHPPGSSELPPHTSSWYWRLLLLSNHTRVRSEVSCYRWINMVKLHPGPLLQRFMF